MIRERTIRNIRRRNTSIRIYESGGAQYVAKKFHAKYKVDQEAKIYKILKPCTQEINGFKLANLIKVDSHLQELYMEYVPGPTLKELMARDGLKSISESYIEKIIDLSIISRRYALVVDADPSNFIIDDRDGSLTLIDPLIDAPGLNNSVVVVFLWGLIKYKTRFIYRLNEIDCFMRLWKKIVSEYVRRSNIVEADLYRELKKYADLVIEWNIKESGEDRNYKRAIRVLFIVPVWFCISLKLKYIALSKS